MNRRLFLAYGGLTAIGSLLPFGLNSGWIARSAEAPAPDRRLIVFFLRGGVDSLNTVVPHHENAYYDARPTLAIAPPGEKDGALPLDNRFGLHPALASLQPFWQRRELAFVHASGLTVTSRSHFDAQALMEMGVPEPEQTRDGWLGRYLNLHATPKTVVSLGATLPIILLGVGRQAQIVNPDLGPRATRALASDRTQVRAAFDRLYSGDNALARAYRDGQQAREKVLTDLETETVEANRGAPKAERVARQMAQLARLFKGNTRAQIAFIPIGGWDTHIRQERVLHANLEQFGTGLAVLARELGDLYADTTIVVLSEFGRTVAENGNGGTDHGRGGALWVLGGSVRGGRVYGDWPGLAIGNRADARDLAITTDYRQVIAEVLLARMGVAREQLARIFPGFTNGRPLGLMS